METTRAPLLAVVLLAVVFPLELIYGVHEYGLPIYLGVGLANRAVPGVAHFLWTAGYIGFVIAPTLSVLFLLEEIKQLEINTPAGADHAFEVTRRDAKRVLDGLQSRDQAHVTAGTRRA